MKYLVIFKRFEIWLLLAVIGFVFYSAFRPEEKEPDPVVEVKQPVEVVPSIVKAERTDSPAEDAGESAVAEKDLLVEEVSIIGGGGLEPKEGQVVEVTLLARSNSGKMVRVDESTLKAATDTGTPVAHFFEPFKREQMIRPDEPSLVTVRFWLEQPSPKMWLDFQGERTEVVLPELAAEL
ncbi:MAG: hypothetical protein P1U87_15360 [Verrucomicrobiales bacterium]|nr:hypothetical protein [Verrucomicrobiales bacterium]